MESGGGHCSSAS
ncbi:hypothetical protein L195_g064307, partial [Trifolium pratense]